MAQATTQGKSKTPKAAGNAELVTALYDVVRFSRHTRTADPIEPAGVVVLTSAHRLAPARPSDIACDVKLDLSTVSRHLRSLESDGFIQRTDDPTDKRAQRVEPTQAGLDALLTVIGNRAATLDQAMTDWSAADRATLTTLLRQLAIDMAAADPTPRTTTRGI